MAEDSPVQGLCEETTCSVCLEYFKDPVTIDCGHNFCRACLTQCWEKTDRAPSCPQCRETVQQQNLRPNRQLASIVEIARKLSLHRIKGAEALGPVCGRHQEPLKLFCQDDQTPICMVCDKSKEHRGHQVIPKEEAFEEYKVKVQDYLEFLKKEREEMRSSEKCGAAEGQALLEQTESERQKIVAEFKQLHRFLEAQEVNLLAKLKDLDDWIKDKRSAHMDKLSEEISAVDLLIKEMEEKQKQLASEFLQDIRNILQRCNKEKFVNPVAFPLDFKQQIEDFSKIHPFLETTMDNFKETVLAGPEGKKAKFTDRGTVPTLDSVGVPTLVVTKQQPLSWNSYNQNPNQWSCWSYVMGVERINSGSCSWVMNIANENLWAVGVALEHFRKGCISEVTPKHGIWAVGMSSGKWYAFDPHGKRYLTLLWPSGQTPACPIVSCNAKTIRISLNHEQGSVTFFNADDNSVIYAFPRTSFSRQPVSSWFFVAK